MFSRKPIPSMSSVLQFSSYHHYTPLQGLHARSRISPPGMESPWTVDAGSSLTLSLGTICSAQRTDLLANDEGGDLQAKLARMMEENGHLSEALSSMYADYNALKAQLLDLAGAGGSWSSSDMAAAARSSSPTSLPPPKRKSESQIENSSSEDEHCKRVKGEPKPNVYKTYVRTERADSSSVVNDGYQWRKYGQKVTRDNPSPRAYFRCSFAPSCPVKKKVQRSAENPMVLVATYEGEHCHGQPSAAAGSQAVMTPSGPSAITLDLTQKIDSPPIRARGGATWENVVAVGSPELQRARVAQMAASLASDPTFTAVLASAISSKILGINKVHDK